MKKGSKTNITDHSGLVSSIASIIIKAQVLILSLARLDLLNNQSERSRICQSERSRRLVKET